METNEAKLGIVFGREDATAPTLQGIENGQIYYGDLEISLNESAEEYERIALDGEEMTFTDGKATITADNKAHTVAVKDRFGNEISYTVNVMKKYTVKFIADGNVVETQSVGHGLDADLPEIPEKEGYNETAPTWDKDGKNITSDTDITAVYTKNEPGEFIDATPSTNVGGGSLADDIEDIKTSVPLTPEELWDVEHGADVSVWIEISDASNAVSEEDKELIAQKLGLHKVGIYLDICMFKQIGQDSAVKLLELNDHVTITMQIPESLINKNGGIIRTYRIIRVHDGAAEIIDTAFDSVNNTISFETDRFSTYALSYVDVVRTTATTTPGTGDSDSPWLWAVILGICGMGICGITLYQLKKRSSK